MNIEAKCPYCGEKGNMKVKETGRVQTRTENYAVHKIGCCRCGRSFWKHEGKDTAEKTKWNF